MPPFVLKPETGPKNSFSIKIFDSDLKPLKKRNKNETASSPGKWAGRFWIYNSTEMLFYFIEQVAPAAVFV